MSGLEKELALALYKDTASPAAKRIGDSLYKVVNAILTPADRFVEAAGSAVDELARRLTSADDLVEEPPLVAAKALEGLCMEREDSLRELFLNLLETALRKTGQGSLHPSFPAVIAQLSPLEAKALDAVWPASRRVWAQVKQIDRHGFTRVSLEVAVWPDLPAGAAVEKRPALDVAISNLERLRLIELRPERHPANPRVPFQTSAVPRPQKFRLTPYGAAFCTACV